MNRHPPQPDHGLDAEERALAALLPRPLGRTEPGAELDARILAAARAATEPANAKPAVRRRSWIAPTAVAASLMLAVGLAWQLRPPASPYAGAQAEATASATGAGNDAMMARSIEAPPPPADVIAPIAEPAQMKPMPQPAQPLPSAQFARAPAAPPPAEPPLAAVAAAPPPAPPAPPAPVVMDTPAAASMPAPQAAEAARMAPPAMAKSARTDGFLRERAGTAGNAPTREQDKAAMAADATTLDTITVVDPTAEEPDEDVPPATADSPDVRDAWLRRIGELLKQGKADDARASLAEFRRRYPEAVVPQELRKLEH